MSEAPDYINKPWREMTDAELQGARDYWQSKLDLATSWGAAVSVAGKFVKAAEREQARRVEAPNSGP